MVDVFAGYSDHVTLHPGTNSLVDTFASKSIKPGHTIVSSLVADDGTFALINV